MLAPFAKLDAINGTLNRVMASKVTGALKGLKDFSCRARWKGEWCASEWAEGSRQV